MHQDLAPKDLPGNLILHGPFCPWKAQAALSLIGVRRTSVGNVCRALVWRSLNLHGQRGDALRIIITAVSLAGLAVDWDSFQTDQGLQLLDCKEFLINSRDAFLSADIGALESEVSLCKHRISSMAASSEQSKGIREHRQTHVTNLAGRTRNGPILFCSFLLVRCICSSVLFLWAGRPFLGCHHGPVQPGVPCRDLT